MPAERRVLAGVSAGHSRPMLPVTPLDDILPPDAISATLFEPPTVGRPSRTALAPSLVEPTGAFPDTVIDSGWLGPFEVRATSACGASHRINGTGREDAYRFALTSDCLYLIAAVADGTSAAEHAAIGARIAADTAVALLQQALRTVAPAVNRMATILRRGVTPDCFPFTLDYERDLQPTRDDAHRRGRGRERARLPATGHLSRGR